MERQRIGMNDIQSKHDLSYSFFYMYVYLKCTFRDPEPFDWYQRYAGLKDLIGQYFKKTDNLLMSGAGNSSTYINLLYDYDYNLKMNLGLTEDMLEDGM